MMDATDLSGVVVYDEHVCTRRCKQIGELLHHGDSRLQRILRVGIDE